ncbi:hypothetical protein RND81_07G061900 [Saponaria officinalis]|uniref:Uncharacterized protein n=1 Tax=Saponaria officinalis TaxID=3572 RepID=A0AAW1JMX9_SAPOF
MCCTKFNFCVFKFLNDPCFPYSLLNMEYSIFSFHFTKIFIFIISHFMYQNTDFNEFFPSFLIEVPIFINYPTLISFCYLIFCNCVFHLFPKECSIKVDV